ncbi:cytochrome P450 [Sistotremastrum suecicum HHB10207 ss-3]|uniref:Cytochrome P450 n=1 Tax=Sistotremastrum suecicum HHB10207 ss-3 TaxID=1314776 RepID=A0A166FM87_9AGAM|nr:cytochrome P450 [Sistotremastrum suecicum HHB10207 ss-3]
MIPVIFNPVGLAGTTVLLILWAIIRWRRRTAGSTFRALPGPKGLPVFGNVHQIPAKNSWFKFKEWSLIYGDLFHLKIFGNNVVVITSYKIAQDLLLKRGAIYSSRPPAPLLADYAGFYYSLAALPMGDFMHGQRRLLNQFLNPSAARNYDDFLAQKARSLAWLTHQKPERFQAYNRMHMTATALKIAYGFEVASEGDPWVTDAEDMSRSLESLGTFGTHPIDVFPILGKLPFWIWGRTFAEGMERAKKGAYNTSSKPYGFIKEQVAKGEANLSMASELIESHTLPDGSVEQEETISSACSHVYAAGADTTVSAIDTFALAMLLHPEIQRKAQRELDDLLQGERLPTLADRDSLPYTQAVFKEVLRWKPIVPLGLPHVLEQDDIYNDMLIPAGSLILADIYDMASDSRHFPDPSTFNPDRFLKYEGEGRSLRVDVCNPEDFIFGFGRRICPGRHLASGSLWIALATMLSVFDIAIPTDVDGNKIMPDMEYESGLVSHPKTYRGDFTPRSKNALELLAAAIESPVGV